MAYDNEFIDGFDKYGMVGLQAIGGLLPAMAGEWTGVAATGGTHTLTITPGLAAMGRSLTYRWGFSNPGGTYFGNISKTLPANYARIIGGGYYVVPTAPINSGTRAAVITLTDGSTDQVAVYINSTGGIEVYRGLLTALLGSGGSVSFGTQENTIEWDITIHPSAGIVKVWLNNTLIINLTGQNTRASANSYFNIIKLQHQGNGTANTGNTYSAEVTVDHFYNWYFLASGGSETPALSNAVVETSIQTSDSAVAWTPGAGIIGKWLNLNATNNAPGANQLALVPITAEQGCNITNIRLLPQATSAGAKFKAVLYADSSGSPGSLIATGTEVVGCTAATYLTLPFSAAQAITDGTAYWVGYITDTSVAMYVATSATTGQKKANTYTSGAPNPAGSMTTGQSDWVIFGTLSSMTENWPQDTDADQYVPNYSDLSYNYSATVNQEDLYNFAPLSTTPITIYTVAVKGFLKKADPGARTIDLRAKSGSTTASGNSPGLIPLTSYQWSASYFDLDPNGSVAWTAAALNAAKSGIKIAS